MTPFQSERRSFWKAAHAPRLRSMKAFAEDEIVLPDTGPLGGRRYRCSYQPWTDLWYAGIASRFFNKFVATGPSQSGKTLTCSVIPTMFHLFEVVETVIFFAPKMEICEEKWLIDIKPTIEKSRYAKFLPRSGRGSQGGFAELITFGNGANLKFMTGAGGDKNKAAFTARVAVGTEIDGMDEASETSRETDPISQISARLRSFGSRAIEYHECTVSFESGRIWQELKEGSDSKIVLQCPHCFMWVTPEREHFLGWMEAANEKEAELHGRFYCPECGTSWSPDQRRQANSTCKLVHKGQKIGTDGAVAGPVPETRTFGFRWSAVNNQFTDESQIGREEWQASKKPDNDSVEKERKQFVWCIPVKSEAQDQVPLNLSSLLSREHQYPRGICPPDSESIVLGLDLGSWWAHWTAIAWGSRARGYIVDYGRIAVPTGSIGVEAALMEAMREFRSMSEKGWQKSGGGVLIPDENLIDSGWKTTVVYRFIQETGLPFRACKGLSAAGEEVHYHRPKSTGSLVLYIGDGWHLAKLDGDRINLLEIDANWAKTTLHARLVCDINAPGAISMFQVDRSNHEQVEERHRFVKHLTAEKGVEEFIPKRGTVTKWTKVRRENHHLDSTALGVIGGSINGVIVTEHVPEKGDEQFVEHQVPQAVQSTEIISPAPSEQFVRQMTAPINSSRWARRGA